MKKKKKNHYERKQVYSLEKIFSILSRLNFQGHFKLDGDRMKASSLRYKTFVKNLECVNCGIKGVYFAKERTSPKDPYHLNLYGIAPNGSERLMTKDHIFPKSLGGTDDLDNLQTMCERCNTKKGNKIVKQNNKKEKELVKI
jgi:5-methylcytosine-specific restriction endonuclease McrA